MVFFFFFLRGHRHHEHGISSKKEKSRDVLINKDSYGVTDNPQLDLLVVGVDKLVGADVEKRKIVYVFLFLYYISAMR